MHKGRRLGPRVRAKHLGGHSPPYITNPAAFSSPVGRPMAAVLVPKREQSISAGTARPTLPIPPRSPFP